MKSRVAQLLGQAAADQFVDEDGEAARFALLPPASRDRDAHESFMAMHAGDPEFLALSAECAGFELGSIEVRFDEPWAGQVTEFALPGVYGLAGDGFGNFWVLEVSATGMTGPVWFISHDPPVHVLIAPTLLAFVAEVLNAHRPHANTDQNAFANSHALADAVWAGEHAGTPAGTARRSTDPLIASFAATFPENAVVLDTRPFRPGDGYVWAPLDPYGTVIESGTTGLRAARQKGGY